MDAVKIIGDIGEILMLACFGFSWPVNAIKAYKARTAKSTSLFFICLILTGYVGGILMKVSRGIDYIFFLYIINIILVGANLVIYFRNRALDKKNEK